MAIYDRSNIDYSGMIRDMINARTAGAKIAADNIRRQGELWGNFAKDIGGVASRTWDSAHLDDTDMPGIANYVAFGDSSLLDRQLAKAAARRQMAEQQVYQAKQNALNRKFQEEQNALNRDLQERLADKSRANASEDKTDAARLKYQQLLIEREEIKRKGGDTRLIEAELEQIKNKYGFEIPQNQPYDPRNNVDYVLAKYGEVGKDNDLASIDEAITAIQKYQTPEAAKRLAELDKVRAARVKYDDALKHEKELIAGWTGGELSDGLVNLGYTTKLAGNYVKLMDKSGKAIKSVKIKSNSSNDDWPD